MDEIILRSGKKDREPMDFERLKFLCWFVAGILGEIFGFILILVVILGMAGVLR